MRILNVCCGEQDYGTDRIDFIKTKTTTLVADVEKGLPYNSETFDKVYCSYGYEHMKNPFNLLLEMTRVCKLEGEVIIITDNANYIPTNFRKKALHGNHRIGNDRHYCYFTPEHLKNHFESAGLEITYNSFHFWDNVNTFKSLLLHKFLLLFFGERFAMPSIKTIGIKNAK